MVNKYRRKTNQGSWTEENMRLAIEEAKKTSLARASRIYGIPLGTLHRHVKSGTHEKKLGRFRSVFSQDEEKELSDHARDLDDRFYSLTKEALKELAFKVANQNGIKHPFKNNNAGEAWLRGFMARNPDLSFRTPEPTSIARCSAFNKRQVDHFYDNLWTVIEKYHLQERPDDIFNMDETGVKTSVQKPPKVLSGKGKRQVGVISSAEKGQLTTVICCCSAAGRFIPPCLIFGNRKKINERLLDGGPIGSKAWCSDSGWINSDLFVKWLQFFIDCVRPSKESPALLILDNHISHQNLDALNLARSSGVILLSVPPHTTHKLQPLDVAVYKPFKTAFERAVDNYQKNHPARRITQFEVAQLVKVAFEKSATIETALNGFRKAGIFPYNRDIFTSLDFAPAEVHHIPSEDEAHQQRNTDSSDEDIPLSSVKERHKISTSTVTCNVKSYHQSPNATSTTQALVHFEPEAGPSGVSSKTLASDPKVTPIKLGSLNVDKSPETSYSNLQPKFTADSTPPPLKNKKVVRISPKDILPLPKAAHAANATRKAKCQKSEILTSSPYKLMVEEKEKRKRPKSCNLLSKIEGENHSKPCRTNKGTAIKGTGKEQDTFCLVCGEEYILPPTETWIQCDKCGDWAHEMCADLTGMDEHYFCDNCK